MHEKDFGGENGNALSCPLFSTSKAAKLRYDLTPRMTATINIENPHFHAMFNENEQIKHLIPMEDNYRI